MVTWSTRFPRPKEGKKRSDVLNGFPLTGLRYHAYRATVPFPSSFHVSLKAGLRKKNKEFFGRKLPYERDLINRLDGFRSPPIRFIVIFVGSTRAEIACG
jgi:hypothetical protein